MAAHWYQQSMPYQASKAANMVPFPQQFDPRDEYLYSFMARHQAAQQPDWQRQRGVKDETESDGEAK